MCFCSSQIISSYTELVEEVTYLAATDTERFSRVSKEACYFPKWYAANKTQLEASGRNTGLLTGTWMIHVLYKNDPRHFL